MSTPIVFVASKRFMGAWASPPKEFRNEQKLDVTSAGAKNSKNRVTFSPMEMKGYTDADEGTYPCYEAYWQSLKVIDGIDHTGRKKYWKSIKTPKRRDPKMNIIEKGKKIGTRSVLHAKHKRFSNQQINYVDSRKLIYVPDYFKYIKDEPHFLELKRQVQAGKVFIVYDYDGPKNSDGDLACERVTVEMLRQRIHDTSFPFGHGFVVAAALAGIPPEAYTI